MTESQNRALETEVIKLQQEILRLKADNEDLRSLQEMFSKAFYDNQTCMAITRLDNGVYLDVNDNYANSMGYSKEGMIGKTVLELGIWGEPEDRHGMHEELVEQGYIKDVMYKFRRKTGEIGYGLATVNIVNIDGEKHLLTSFIDITERKKAKNALDQSQKLFNQVFNSIPLSIIISSLDGTVIEINETFLHRNNVRRHEVIGQSGVNRRFWKEPQDWEEYLRDVKRLGWVKNIETEYNTPMGEVGTMLLSGILINWEGEESILSIGNDITELRQYKTEITRLDNLNLIGQMAASIAHEVRNPMTSIRGFLQLFQSQHKYIDDKEVMDLMIEEIDRINEIISTFLSIAPKNSLALKLQSLNDSVNSLLPLIVADAFKHDVYIETELTNVPQIIIDECEIRQLLLNLVRNGVQAMSEGGTLSIKTFEDNDGVNLIVQDEGNGMPPEILDKIGIPFFTTKENGTGLGMAVCYSIVERHDAKITFETSPGGTSFKVTFPAAG